VEVSYVATLDAADASLGGKARSLARLAAAGLPTPAGFAITDALFRALCPTIDLQAPFDDTVWTALAHLREQIQNAPWPDGFPEELALGLRNVGGERFSVRSSFAGEDMAGALAAGVYESCVNVPAAGVAAAIRRVLASAVSLGAAAYAMAHDRKPGEAPVAVLIHAYAPGDAEGSAAFAPGANAEPEWMLRRGNLPSEAKAELQSSLKRLARELGPVEIEWVLSERGPVYLQVRPFQPKGATIEWPGWKDLPASNDRKAWHWDMAHNPLPLSPAQAGLVEFVDQHCQVGIRQRVLGGYLFYASDDRPLPPAMEEGAKGYFDGLRADFETRLHELGPKPALESALLLFASVYERIFGVLQPPLKRARQQLQSFVRKHAPARLPLLPALAAGVPSMAEERRRRAAAIRQALTDEARSAATAEYLHQFGDEAPIWDLSVPTYAEDPAPLQLHRSAAREESSAVDWRTAGDEVADHLAGSERETWRQILPLAREAISLSEADDWLYARAQAVVRRALLAIGRALEVAGRLAHAADVFFLPFPLARDLGCGASRTTDLLAIATGGRTTWQLERMNPPPVAITADDKAVRGHGTGGHAIGRIALHRADAFRSQSPDVVLLAPTLLPTELPLVAAAAIVTETGGPLDHVAAQARERGIPAVIGAVGATSVFAEGDLVLVDAEQGLVVRLARA